jgi:hypothetical protein
MAARIARNAAPPPPCSIKGGRPQSAFTPLIIQPRRIPSVVIPHVIARVFAAAGTAARTNDLTVSHLDDAIVVGHGVAAVAKLSLEAAIVAEPVGKRTAVVFLVRDGFEMCRIAAFLYPAEMVDLQSVGDRPDERGIGNAMRAGVPPSYTAVAVALLSEPQLPNPARRRMSAILDADALMDVFAMIPRQTHFSRRPFPAGAMTTGVHAALLSERSLSESSAISVRRSKGISPVSNREIVVW